MVSKGQIQDGSTSNFYDYVEIVYHVVQFFGLHSATK